MFIVEPVDRAPKIAALGFGHGITAPWSTGTGFGHGPFGHVRRWYVRGEDAESYFVVDEAVILPGGFGFTPFGDDPFGFPDLQFSPHRSYYDAPEATRTFFIV